DAPRPRRIRAPSAPVLLGRRAGPSPQGVAPRPWCARAQDLIGGAGMAKIKTRVREEGRLAAEEARAAAAMRARRSRTLAIVGLVLAFTALAIAVVVILGQEEKNIAYPGEPGSLALADVVAPASAHADGGIPVGPGLVAGTGSGSGAVVVDVLFDYRCPYCADFEAVVGPELTRLADSGAITL